MLRKKSEHNNRCNDNMLTALLLGILFGFILSIPPGPLAVAVIKKSFEGRFLPAFMTGFGAAVMDVVYTLVATFASSALVMALSSLFIRFKWLSLLFQVLCIVVLVLLGLKYLRQKHRAPSSTLSATSKNKPSPASPFWVGVLIAFMNLASPTFLPAMVASVSYLHGEGMLDPGFWESVSYSSGFGIGTLLWFFALVRFLIKQRKKLSPNFISSIYKFAGGTFILFALVLAYKIVRYTNWGALF